MQQDVQGSQYHSSERHTCADISAASIIGINTICGVFRHNFGIVAELAANLFDHALSSSPHGADCQGAKEEDQRETDQCRYEDREVGKVDAINRRAAFESAKDIQVSAEKQETC